MEVTNVKSWFVNQFHYKLVESTLPYSKIANFVESKLSTWQNIADVNMNKRK